MAHSSTLPTSNPTSPSKPHHKQPQSTPVSMSSPSKIPRLSTPRHGNPTTPDRTGINTDSSPGSGGTNMGSGGSSNTTAESTLAGLNTTHRLNAAFGEAASILTSPMRSRLPVLKATTPPSTAEPWSAASFTLTKSPTVPRPAFTLPVPPPKLPRPSVPRPSAPTPTKSRPSPHTRSPATPKTPTTSLPDPSSRQQNRTLRPLLLPSPVFPDTGHEGPAKPFDLSCTPGTVSSPTDRKWNQDRYRIRHFRALNRFPIALPVKVDASRLALLAPPSSSLDVKGGDDNTDGGHGGGDDTCNDVAICSTPGCNNKVPNSPPNKALGQQQDSSHPAHRQHTLPSDQAPSTTAPAAAAAARKTSITIITPTKPPRAATNTRTPTKPSTPTKPNSTANTLLLRALQAPPLASSAYTSTPNLKPRSSSLASYAPGFKCSLMDAQNALEGVHRAFLNEIRARGG